MDDGAAEVLRKEPTEEEFCQALRNGLILCNVLNRVNPGAVHKVVDNPAVDALAPEGAAQSAIQYFENMRNFLVAVGRMQLLTFEASDLEKGGSSGKVVDCILCLKGYYEWREAGGIGVWRYGGTVRIMSYPKGSSSSSFISSESADESLDDSESSQYDQLLDYLHIPDLPVEESTAAKALNFLFDQFSLKVLQACLIERDGFEDFPLNSMVIDAVLKKVVKDFSTLLVSQSNQLSVFAKNILNSDCVPLSKSEFLEAMSKYLGQRTHIVSNDFSKLCVCGGLRRQNNESSNGCLGLINHQQRQIAEFKTFCKETKQEVRKFQLGCEEELKRLEHHVKGLEEASASYHKVLEENRLLYNQVQDLKGTIRVYCRVRPFLPGQSDMQSTVDYIGENGRIMIANPYKQGKDARRIFSFNKVFGTNVTQGQIYMDTQPLIRSVLDGFNVCIFAYGQTGSGKTYTMSGPDLTTEETWGVNYRALGDLFQISNQRMNATKYEIGVQMIEIYNEQVRDLLVVDGTNRRLDVRNNSQLNGLNVPDASLVPVTCTQDVLDLMKIGQRNRAVGATALNERSSRSHSILTVHVQGEDLISGSTLKGCLHLVDLAGSERVDKSEAVGERLREAQHINRSLSALGDVISALAQKSPHIPYRNSKLTQVLQDSLGGQAKTLMFVHINPEVNAVGETISTLKFAERVATVDLGAARSNKETADIREMKEEISSLKLVLEKKEAELEQFKSTNTRGVSPFRLPRQNTITGLKETNQRLVDDTRNSEVRSCSSGKQRRSVFPSKFTDKEIAQKLPFVMEERLVPSSKPRTPSPPIRRSLSTDRGALVRSRIKPETLENPPVVKLPLLTRVPSQKSSTITSSVITSTNNRLSEHQSSYEPFRHEKLPETLKSLQRVTTRKTFPEQEEQLKQVLYVKQAGVRKIKPDIKAKTKHPSAKLQRSDVATTLLSDLGSGRIIEDTEKSDSSTPENEHDPANIGLTAYNSLEIKRPQKNSRNSQNVQPRESVQSFRSLLSREREDKFSHNVLHIARETTSTSIPELRRSRSTPRGKFFIIP